MELMNGHIIGAVVHPMGYEGQLGHYSKSKAGQEKFLSFYWGRSSQWLPSAVHYRLAGNFLMHVALVYVGKMK